VTRIRTALVGLPLFFVFIKYLHPAFFMALVAVSVVIASWEMFALAERGGLGAHRFLGAALGVAMAYSFFDPRLPTLEVLLAALLIVPIASLARIRGGAERAAAGVGAVGVTLMTVLYVGMLMGFIVALLADGGARGRDLTVLLFWVVWLADAAAYAVGSLWGRRKLMPAISPGKTVEGALGALVAAVAAALVARAWFFTRLTLGDALAVGVLLAIAGMLGDLFESMLKRAAAVKDSGAWFPGHGGMLDRTDSLLFAAPVLFYYHKYFIA
jgi:phosphatidate cytidylyltransferase